MRVQGQSLANAKVKASKAKFDPKSLLNPESKDD